ncbi:MAG: hypothetical protein AB1646_22060 [Thermodesulfobacteriota bacterium]
MMRRLAVAFLIAVICVWGAGFAFAEEPLSNLESKQVRPAPATPPSGQPQPFYGYVPPAPVRHTWPGGYKVIFHEMMNSLVSHILGRY